MKIRKFKSELKEYLKYYVYIYLDPDTDEIFYVGKGKGDRVFSHLGQDGESEKIAKIKELYAQGKEPKIEILIHGLEDEEAALKVEAAVIDLIGIHKLTNRVHGYKSALYGRLGLEELGQRYSNEVAEISEPSILIRINQLYHYGMSKIELYDATRGCWKLGENREKIRFAFAIYDGIVQEVYKVQGWFKGGETLSSSRDNSGRDDRWEFVGNIAPDKIRRKYLNKSVGHLFKKGNQNPIIYLNIN